MAQGRSARSQMAICSLLFASATACSRPEGSSRSGADMSKPLLRQAAEPPELGQLVLVVEPGHDVRGGVTDDRVRGAERQKLEALARERLHRLVEAPMDLLPRLVDL